MDKGLIVHALLFNEKQEVLLIRRSLSEDVLPGVWDIPGGTLHDGEDPVEGAIRETTEEVGLNIKNLSLFHYTSNIDQKKNKQFIRLIFIGTCDSFDVVLNPEDHDKYQWVPSSHLPQNMELVDYLPEVFDILKEKKHLLANYYVHAE
ncbi:MAG: NUDIX hydrolase [Candidatus Moraniibacteriota bacterium]|nr:MAG: NUDIX hydrolase [Candidatus Moranbacteria bacterium]